MIIYRFNTNNKCLLIISLVFNDRQTSLINQSCYGYGVDANLLCCDIDVLAQGCGNSIANAQDFTRSYSQPSIIWNCNCPIWDCAVECCLEPFQEQYGICVENLSITVLYQTLESYCLDRFICHSWRFLLAITIVKTCHEAHQLK